MIITINTTSKTFQRVFASTLAVAAVACFALAAYSWTGPTGSPPSNNVAAPINTGTASQVKDGPLSVDGLSVYGDQYVTGNLGIGASPGSTWKINAQGASYGIYADATSGQAIRGAITGGGTGYAGYFDSLGGGSSSAGGLFARNGAGYYAYIGYPGTSWGVYTNGRTYASSYSRADGGFCIGGSCKTSWSAMGGSYWTGYIHIASYGSPTVGCASGYVMTGVGTNEGNGDWRVDNLRILCTSLAP